MKAVILAAGRGTRMKELTKNVPKPMIEVNGFPFLQYLFDNLKKAGFTDIGIVVSWKKEVIGEWAEENGTKVKIIEQGEPLGTGHAVQSVEKWTGNEDFIVVNGDNLYSEDDMKKMGKEDEFCYVGGMEGLDQTKLGALVTEDGKLVHIVEKPEKPISKLSSVGVYKFTPEIFDKLRMIKKSSRGEYEITDAIELLCREGKVKACRINDYWIDFTKPEDIEKVEEFLKKKD